MKFKRCEPLTQTKIKNWFRWFNEWSYNKEYKEYKLAHFYKHDKFAYTIIMVDKTFGTPFELYIDTDTAYATIQRLSAVVVNKSKDISDLVFDK